MIPDRSDALRSDAAKRVYFNEFNLRMGRMCYLPLVSGLLRAHAETDPAIAAGFRFMPFLYHIDAPERILAAYEAPDVAAFSVSMWNEQLNLTIAAEVKRRWPDCLVVFGGAQVPHEPTAFFAQYGFVDVTVRGEGEEAFTEILQRRLAGGDLGNLPGVSWRDGNGAVHVSQTDRPFKRELDSYPSPYLTGLFDDLIAAQGETLEFQAIIETNRGCPFQCTFCYWGRGGLSRKYRYHDQDRVLAEIEWCAQNRIRYVFNADSNFGMHRRDQEIAAFIVATKKKYGFPEKFRTCYGKNTDDKIFRIGSLFHRHQLEKGITLSRQSNDDGVLRNIKRANIKMATYKSLQARFNDEDIPIYSELILGLPGETAASFRAGISEILEAGLKNQLFIYLAQVYPNTDLGDPTYQEKFGIKTRRIALNEIHGTVRPAEWVTEFEDVVAETATMTRADWRDMVVFAWLTMLMHSLKLGYFLMLYLYDRLGVKHADLLDHIARASGAGVIGDELKAFQDMLDRMEAGSGRGYEMPGYGGIYWDVEEASFLRITERLDQFYDELHGLIGDFLDQRGLAYDPAELAEVVRYQRLRIPTRQATAPRAARFTRNLPEYFAARFSSDPRPLLPVAQDMILDPVDFGGAHERFARETILWGRKSGTMLVRAGFEPSLVSAAAE